MIATTIGRELRVIVTDGVIGPIVELVTPVPDDLRRVLPGPILMRLSDDAVLSVGGPDRLVMS